MKPAFFEAVRASVFGGHLTQAQVDGMNAIDSAFAECPEADDRHVAYGIATAIRESGIALVPTTEQGPVEYFAKYGRPPLAGQLGNTQPGDSFNFRGRGFAMLTGRGNYSRVGRLIGRDLVGEPWLLLDLQIAATVLARGMMNGWFTGAKLPTYLAAHSTDYVNARRTVNGLDHAFEIATHAEAIEKALKA